MTYVLSMNRRRPRQVLECASLLALWQWRRANQKRQRTGAVQDATARSAGSGSQCMRKNERGLSMNRRLFLVVVLVLVIDWVVCLRGRRRARGRVGSWSQCATKRRGDF